MADAWLWENGDRILLEDSSGVWILEEQPGADDLATKIVIEEDGMMMITGG